MQDLKKHVSKILYGVGYLKQKMVFAFLMLATSPCFAGQTTGLPWENALDTIKKSISGPVAMSIGIIMIVISGLALGLGDFHGGAKKFAIVILGLSVAFSATGVVSTLFGSAGALI